MRDLPISRTRLWDSLMAMARIGATARGGCDRQALTDADGAARRQLARWGEALGLALSVDRVGNMALRREGADPARPPVAIGSHLDTQPTGGRFDGALGVLAGLEVLRALAEAGLRTRAPLLLVNWTNEEGARFAPPMMGSGVAAGVFAEGEVLAATDPAGAVFGAELARIGWRGEADPAWARGLAAYLELHIEQGPVLEAAGAVIGVVTAAAAQAWFEVTVTGAEAHAGNPMAMRRDALAAASHMIAAVEGLALEHGGAGTVGRLAVHPDSRNVVPGRVWFTVDLRHAEEAVLGRMVAALHARLAAIAAARGVGVAVVPFWSCPTTPFDPALAARVRAAAGARGLAQRDMVTGIGHDAVHLARVVPTALIFVPCHGGISHNEAESITPEWAEAGCRVLADVALATAEIA